MTVGTEGQTIKSILKTNIHKDASNATLAMNQTSFSQGDLSVASSDDIINYARAVLRNGQATSPGISLDL